MFRERFLPQVPRSTRGSRSVAKFPLPAVRYNEPVQITPEDPFHWRHYEPEVILCCVRWYMDLPLSYRNGIVNFSAELKN
jgi:hypothetical protein